MHQWFLKDDVWHAFNLSAPEALCGETRIIYGTDPITDILPVGATAHPGCLAAINGEPAPAPKAPKTPKPPKAKGKK